MDSKGIEFQGLNLLPAPQLKDIKKDTSVIKPVQKGSRGALYPDVRKKRSPCLEDPVWSLEDADKEDASKATEIMSECLRNRPDLESDWTYDDEHGILVVEVRNKNTGEVIRQIPPEEILSGRFVSGPDASGNVISRVA